MTCVSKKEEIEMPFGDGTGPRGMGPMTGRGMGYCAGFPTPGYMNPGYGRGGGRGRRNWFYATGMPGWVRAAQGMPAFGGVVAPPANPYMQPPTAEDEKAMLKDQAEFLKKQLDELQKRIGELESDKS
jgi:hypothetical protein